MDHKYICIVFGFKTLWRNSSFYQKKYMKNRIWIIHIFARLMFIMFVLLKRSVYFFPLMNNKILTWFEYSWHLNLKFTTIFFQLRKCSLQVAAYDFAVKQILFVVFIFQFFFLVCLFEFNRIGTVRLHEQVKNKHSLLPKSNKNTHWHSNLRIWGTKVQSIAIFIVELACNNGDDDKLMFMRISF